MWRRALPKVIVKVLDGNIHLDLLGIFLTLDSSLRWTPHPADSFPAPIGIYAASFVSCRDVVAVLEDHPY